MKSSRAQAVSTALWTLSVLGAVTALAAAMLGGRPNLAETVLWMALIIFQAAFLAHLSDRRRRRLTLLERWGDALDTQERLLTERERELHWKEWTLTWAETAPGRKDQ